MVGGWGAGDVSVESDEGKIIVTFTGWLYVQPNMSVHIIDGLYNPNAPGVTLRHWHPDHPCRMRDQLPCSSEIDVHASLFGYVSDEQEAMKQFQPGA